MRFILTWCRRHLMWSNSRQAWEERAGTMGLLAGAFALWWYADRMLPVVQVILWAALLLVGAVLLRRGWLKLFGPVLFYDMVRSARRGRYILMRVLYAGLLFFFLFVVYNNYAWRFHNGQQVQPWMIADIAQTYFETFMVVQLIAVLVLTPAYVAGSIADEKTHKTLEFLLATDLRSREIVLSKICSRLANLAVFILTGLPILSFLQFLGGVDPNLVFAGFAATALTMLGLGGVSILASTYCKRPRDAIALSYLLLFAYYAVAVTLLFVISLLGFNTAFIRPMASDGWVYFFLNALAEVTRIFNFGNLWWILLQVEMAGWSGQLASVIPRLLGEYAAFNGVVFAVCLAWSVLRLRPVALRQMSASKTRRWRRVFGFRFRRPPVGDLPMLWKEMHIEGGLRMHWIVWLITLLLIGLSFVPAFFILHFNFIERYGGWHPSWEYVQREMNGWVRIMTAVVGSLTLLAVAVRAATCVSSERDRQTLDGLLTTPMTASEILAAKTLANVVSLRVAWGWLGLMWLLALLVGGLHPFALPFLLAAWLIYAFFFSLLGTWFSIVSRTSQRAIVYTLLMTVTLAVGHWLPWMCCIPVMYGMGEFRTIAMFQAGMTPPVALGILAFFSGDFPQEHYGYRDMPQFIGYSVCGLFLWFCAALFLWSMVLERFRRLSQRGTEAMLAPYDQPHRWPPPSSRRPRPVGETGPPPQLRGAVLLEETRKPGPLLDAVLLDDPPPQPPKPRGAILIEEVQDPPKPPPAPDKDNK